MTFFERYESVCADFEILPVSEQAAQVIGKTRSAISAWKKTGKTPLGDTVAEIADAYGVSTDYLLGRTDDKTDFARKGALDAQKAPAAKTASAKEREDRATRECEALLEKLDSIDLGKVEAYIQALLTQDKYAQKKRKRA